jgi:protein archease
MYNDARDRMADGWKEVDHTADVALRVWAESLPGLFTQAASGMLALIGGQPEGQAPGFDRAVHLHAPDAETLLVDWLTCILTLMEQESAVVTHASVSQIENVHLSAVIRGQPAISYHKDIKAVTYHNLEIHSTSAGFETTIVFDV